MSAMSPWRLSVAPIPAWSANHVRYLHRLIPKNTRL